MLKQPKPFRYFREVTASVDKSKLFLWIWIVLYDAVNVIDKHLNSRDHTCVHVGMPKIVLAEEKSSLDRINEKIIKCKLCPRLSGYIQEVGKTKTKRHKDESYWAKPVPTFGDPRAKLLIIGLAPAANGGNRTGRIFTGDSSGDRLVRALFEIGFANRPTSITKDDGLILNGAFLTAVTKCAPPQNKPNASEILNCSQYLKSEIKLLEKTIKVIITLGKIAFDAYCYISNVKGLKFGHHKVYPIHNDKTLIVSYHPSRRNTNTGTLTWQMWISVFEEARLITNNNL